MTGLRATMAQVQVAALYVETDGAYYGLPHVDAWDAARDARQYSGPWPVIAHPPCQRWGALARANYARWGGEHNRPGNDGGCFAAALAAVRRWGGVLEHPAKTYAFASHGIPKPHQGQWTRTECGGWVCEVWQSAYGHRAAKATWLYAVTRSRPADLDWRRAPGTHQVGHPDYRGKARNKPHLSRSEANATPEAFRDALIAVALS